MYSKSQIWKNFDVLPDGALASLNDATTILNRSRASIYRDWNDGKLELIKIGSSTRIRVGELRRFMTGSPLTQNPVATRLTESRAAARAKGGAQ